MKNYYTYSFNLILFLFLIGFHLNANAQTYATPELQQQEEKHIAKKNKQLGIKIKPEKINSNTEILNKREKYDSNFVAISVYKLVSIEPLVLPNYSVTPAEFQAFTKTIKTSWVGAKLKFGSNNQISFNNHLGIEKRMGTEAVWLFEKINCPTCSKTLLMTVISESPNELIYLMPDEDEASKFNFKLSFKK